MKKLLVALLSTSLLIIVAQASAKDATNDKFTKATLITSLPFTDDVLDPSGAKAKGEPQPTGEGCAEMGTTVWYSFTPDADTTLSASTIHSNFDTVLAVYTLSGDQFTQVACNDNAPGVLQSFLSFSATGGTTYYFQVGACCDPNADPVPLSGANPELEFVLQAP
jgi:hypothetical protein